MSSFFPKGYVSCMDALQQIHATEFPEHDLPTPDDWRAFVRNLNRSSKHTEENALFDRMALSVNQLLEELYSGNRTAKYVSNYGEHLIEEYRFLQDSAAEMLVTGEITWAQRRTLGNRPKIFIIEKLEQTDATAVEADDGNAPNLPSNGRPIKGRDAALVYWMRYPNGHDKEKIYWPAALDEVNKHLTRLNLPTVGDSTLQKYVEALAPSKTEGQ